MIPEQVRVAIAAAKGSLYGIPGDPDLPSFSEACSTIREWASDLSDDPLEEKDDDEPWCSREQKVKDIVGVELFPYVR